MECGIIERKKNKQEIVTRLVNPELEEVITQRLKKFEDRIKALETQLEEKDRELREVAINRAEFVQQLNVIYDLFRKARSGTNDSGLVKKILNSGLRDTEKKVETSKSKSVITNKEEKDKKLQTLNLITDFEPEKMEFLGKYSYRERLILMNRIDIYRIYVTLIILSSQIRYPRALTDIEEKEMKNFIDELSEFEDLVLDLNIEDDIIWEKGKVCEKQATQLFSRFFNI